MAEYERTYVQSRAAAVAPSVAPSTAVLPEACEY